MNKPRGQRYLWPLILCFFILGTNQLQEIVFRSDSQTGGSAVNQVFLSMAYVMALFFLLRQGRLFRRLLFRAAPWTGMLFFIGISATWSMFPRSVFMSLVHQLGAALVAMCAAILWRQDKNVFFRTLLKVGFLYLIITVLASLLFPSLCRMPEQPFAPGGQWRGLTRHYNGLGAFCCIVIWIAIAHFFLTDKSKTSRGLCFWTAMISFYCLYRTNSMTSTLLSIALVLSATWFLFTRSSYGQTKGRKVVFFIFIIMFMGASAYVVRPEMFSKKFFFELIGRNETFTGRTALWERGFDGVAAHPYVGWSFDSLEGFSKRAFEDKQRQMHNGYLDLVLRGGAVAGGLFLLMFSQMMHVLRKLKAGAYPSYYFSMGLLVVMLVHNVTEASFFRNTNIVWQFFLVLYFYCLLNLDGKGVCAPESHSGATKNCI